MASFTLNSVLFSKFIDVIAYVNTLSFYVSIMFHCMGMPHFVDGHLGGFCFLAIVE